MSFETLGLKLKKSLKMLASEGQRKRCLAGAVCCFTHFLYQNFKFLKAPVRICGIFVYVILYPGDVIGKYIVTMLGNRFVFPHIKSSIWKRMQWISCEISKEIKTWNRPFEKCTNAMGHPTRYQFYSTLALY